MCAESLIMLTKTGYKAAMEFTLIRGGSSLRWQGAKTRKHGNKFSKGYSWSVAWSGPASRAFNNSFIYSGS